MNTAFQNLLDEVSHQLGLPGLAPGEDGSCLLLVEETLVSLMLDEENSSLTLFCEVASLPEELQTVATLRRLLAANFFWRETERTTLGLDPDSGSVLASRHLPLDTTTASRLETEVDNLVAVAERWRQELLNQTEPLAEPLPETGEEDPNYVRV